MIEGELGERCPNCGEKGLYECCIPGGPCGKECAFCGHCEMDSV